MRQLLVAVTLMMMAASIAFAFSVHQYAGTWINRDANTRGITKVEIREHDSKADVRVWAKCRPTDCNWGWENANSYADGHLSTTYRNDFSVRDLTLTMSSRSTLVVKEHTRFTDNSGRPDRNNLYTLRRVFTPAGNPTKPIRKAFPKLPTAKKRY